jgi:hypothetical protein
MELEPRDPSARHFKISMVKSVIRIFAALCLCYGMLAHAGGLLIIAEVFGILEELS